MQGGKGGDVSRADISAPSQGEPQAAPEPKPQPKFRDRPVPPGFQHTLDSILGVLQRHDLRPFEQRPDFLDQVGFLAKLAYADASGFPWPANAEGRPRSLWDFVGRAKLKANPAGWLTQVLREELGPLWAMFHDEIPSPAHCQWLLRKLAEGELTEG